MNAESPYQGVLFFWLNRIMDEIGEHIEAQMIRCIETSKPMEIVPQLQAYSDNLEAAVKAAALAEKGEWAMAELEHCVEIHQIGRGELGFYQACCACGWRGPKRELWTDSPYVNAEDDGEQHIIAAVKSLDWKGRS